MTRVVMLEFKSNSQAEEFVRSMASDSTTIDRHPQSRTFTDAKVVAVVAKPPPNKTCRCDVPTNSSRRRGKRERGWTIGKSFGWTLCVSCHKPSSAVALHFVTNLLAGCNDLLPQILGTGPPISPHNRWVKEGGIPNEYLKGREAPGIRKREHI